MYRISFITKSFLAIVLIVAGFLPLKIPHLGILAVAGLLSVMYKTGILRRYLFVLAGIYLPFCGLHVFPANNMGSERFFLDHFHKLFRLSPGLQICRAGTGIDGGSGGHHDDHISTFVGQRTAGQGLSSYVVLHPVGIVQPYSRAP